MTKAAIQFDINLRGWNSSDNAERRSMISRSFALLDSMSDEEAREAQGVLDSVQDAIDYEVE